MLMAIGHAILRLAVDTDPAPVAVATMMNRALTGTGGPRAFMTFFYGVLDPQSGRFQYVCAGHPFPFLRRRDGEILKLGTGAYPLGLRPQVKLSEAEVTVQPGDTLVLFTDGIPEALGTQGSAFGFDRLQALLAQPGSPQEVHDRILASLAHFEGDSSPLDDRSLVVIRRDG